MFAVLALSFSACNDDTCDTPVVIAQAKLALEKNAFLEDRLGQDALQSIDNIIAAGTQTRVFTLYHLRCDESVESRLAHLKLEAVQDLDSVSAGKRDAWIYGIDRGSFYEAAYDVDRFYASKGVDEKNILSDQQYLDLAFAYTKDSLQYQQMANMKIYPYKMRKPWMLLKMRLAPFKKL